MTSIQIFSLSLSLGIFSALFPPSDSLAREIPPAPYYYVLDEAGVFPPQKLRALQSLLVEHDRITGEQFVVALFKSLEGENAEEFTHRAFLNWRVGKRGKDNGILLTLYLKESLSRVETGVGIEVLLESNESSLILSEHVAPALRENDPVRAVSSGTWEILKKIESPLIQNGKAEKVFKSAGLLTERKHPLHGPTIPGWWFLVFLGGLLLWATLYLLVSAEAHFTRNGWFRPKPWFWLKRRRMGPLKSNLGGASGQW